MFIRHVLRNVPATGALAASLALTGAGPVLAAGDAHRAVVQPDPVAPGEEFSVFDGGNCPGESGEATFDGAGIPTMKLSTLRNQVGGTARVPDSVEPGSYKVTVVCGDGGEDGGHGGNGRRPGAQGPSAGDGLKPQSGPGATEPNATDPNATDPGATAPDGGLPGGGLPGGTAPGGQAPGGAAPGGGATPPADGLPGAGAGAGAGEGASPVPGDPGASGGAVLPGDGAAGAPVDPGDAAGAGLPAGAPVDGTVAAGPAGAVTARAVSAVRTDGGGRSDGDGGRGHRRTTLTGTLTVVAADHGRLPKGGSDTGLGGAAGTGLGTTALGGALLAGAIGWGVVDHRRRSRQEGRD
ncbi:hypothetical protein [Streptomyces catenulae]|uniref:Sortase n=1 Tax=Streptomyces catenulae TaxID=66875 RepID=A0ABV2Z001_9ACTN|nr:hypothetical protein [Streptomyces catenulae]